MNFSKLQFSFWVLLLPVCLLATAFSADYSASLKTGKAELQSAGALAFGPDGILFVGDSMGAAIYALDTQDRSEATSHQPFEISGIDQKVAALLGTAADQILINDLAVNPISQKVYLSVSRGRGPEALPVIVRVDTSGKIEEFSLDNVAHASVALTNAPGTEEVDRRGQSRRLETITDLAFVDERVFVAGLSNEEFASKLRSIPFPFKDAGEGTSVEIYHGAHGRFETNAPVRTFVPFEIDGESHILAAYTCTPLVTFPVSSLEPGAKVMGTTIAELGNRNRPLDMVVYEKGGLNFILMNNSSRGVMKINAQGLEGYQGITARTDITGVPYETIEDLQGVEQLDRLNGSDALILVRADTGSLDLKTIALP
jgi:hypothetical protein